MSPWKRVRNEEGSAIIETALSSLIILGLLFGMFESFFALYAYHFTSYAAREATRYASVRGSNCSGNEVTSMAGCPVTSSADVQSYIRNIGLPGLSSNDVTANVTWHYRSNTNSPATWVSCGGNLTTTTTDSQGNTVTVACNEPGDRITVQVIYAMPLVIPFYKSIPLSMTSTSSLVIAD
ncbi:MAG TPA: TadE/TadG family type IV pilus assembly protein [Acidobacteriaceae bacterium]|nr:TadE/TadG family type IV pilus assembly protein [Acidobacteriaceae bacterium]